jgi:hypothetical protein
VLFAPRRDRYMPDTSLLCSASRRAQIVSRWAHSANHGHRLLAHHAVHKDVGVASPEAQSSAEVDRKDAEPAAHVLQRVALVRVAQTRTVCSCLRRCASCGLRATCAAATSPSVASEQRRHAGRLHRSWDTSVSVRLAPLVGQ